MALFQDLRKSEAGITPLAAVIGMAIVILSLWGFLQASSGLKVQDVRVSRRVQGEALLSSVAVELQQMTFNDLYNVCSAFGALGASPATSRCKPAGGFANVPLYSPPATPSPTDHRLGVRFDLRPGNLVAGTSCVDLVNCTWRARQHILEVKLDGVWMAPPGNKIMNRELIFRKTR